jgi:limonene-1,2-epoxide hydrolase
MGERVSDRQWLDIIGVLKVQGESLDKEYLLEWSEYLDVFKLLKKAFSEAGLWS